MTAYRHSPRALNGRGQNIAAAGLRNAGSLDCVVVREADDNCARDDSHNNLLLNPTVLLRQFVLQPGKS